MVAAYKVLAVSCMLSVFDTCDILHCFFLRSLLGKLARTLLSDCNIAHNTHGRIIYVLIATEVECQTRSLVETFLLTESKRLILVQQVLSELLSGQLRFLMRKILKQLFKNYFPDQIYRNLLRREASLDTVFFLKFVWLWVQSVDLSSISVLQYYSITKYTTSTRYKGVFKRIWNDI